MGKLPALEVSDMPPLTREFHKELSALENLFDRDLGNCVSRDELIDPPKAFEYARTYAVEFYDHYYTFYSQHPDYREHWQPASAAFALQRVVHCLNNWSAVSRYFKENSDRIKRITRTISDHAKRLKSPVLNPSPLPSLARAGVDIASGSPLLKMPHESARSKRPNVWGPVAPEPKKRFSAQVKSESAAHKLAAYMERRGLGQTEFANLANTTDKTIRKFLKTGSVKRSILTDIAAAMGTTREELLS